MFKKLKDMLSGRPSRDEAKLKNDLTQFIDTLTEDDWGVVTLLAGYWWRFGKEKSDLAFIRAIQTLQFAKGSAPEIRGSALRSMEMARQWAAKWGSEAGQWGSECVRLAVAGESVAAPETVDDKSDTSSSPEQAYVRSIQKYRLTREDMQPLVTISGFAWKYANMPAKRAVEFAMQTIYLSRHGSPQERKDADTTWQSAVMWSIDAGLDGVKWGMECVDRVRSGRDGAVERTNAGLEEVTRSGKQQAHAAAAPSALSTRAVSAHATCDSDEEEGEHEDDDSGSEDDEEPDEEWAEESEDALWEARQARKDEARAKVDMFVQTLREPAPMSGPRTRMQEISYASIRAADSRVRQLAKTPYAALSFAVVGATFRCAHEFVSIRNERAYQQVFAQVHADVLMFEAAAWFQSWLLCYLRTTDILSQDDRQILIDPVAKAQAEVSSLFTVIAKFPEANTFGERVHEYPLPVNDNVGMLCRALKADAGRAFPVSSSELSQAKEGIVLPVDATEFCRKALWPLRNPILEFILAAAAE